MPYSSRLEPQLPWKRGVINIIFPLASLSKNLSPNLVAITLNLFQLPFQHFNATLTSSLQQCRNLELVCQHLLYPTLVWFFLLFAWNITASHCSQDKTQIISHCLEGLSSHSSCSSALVTLFSFKSPVSWSCLCTCFSSVWKTLSPHITALLCLSF